MKRQDLEQELNRVRRSISRPDLDFDWTARRPRLGLLDKRNLDCIDHLISPRLTPVQMMLYLDAFEAGYREAEHFHGRKRAI
jgi:hypothetical protein